MRELGFDVAPVDGGMHGTGPRHARRCGAPVRAVVRTSILAAWVDIVCGHAAIGLFDPGVPVTLDLDVHLHRPPVGCEEVEMHANVQKAGRSVSVLSVDIVDGGGEALGFGHATFMAAPNPSLRMPTIVRDAGAAAAARSQPRRCRTPSGRACERVGAGIASIPMRPDGLNASGTLNGGLLALAVEEAALSAAPGTTLASLAMRFVRPVRVGPAIAQAEVRDGLGNVVVRDQGRDDQLAVIATARTFGAG